MCIRDRAYLAQYPDIAIVIDLHRDALGDGDVTYKTMAELDGQEMCIRDRYILQLLHFHHLKKQYRTRLCARYYINEFLGVLMEFFDTYREILRCELVYATEMCIRDR